MTTGDAYVVEEAVDQPIGRTRVSAQIGLEQYYSEAGPDYAAWSPEFNMHFGCYRAGANPLGRESMLEQMNVEVLTGCAWPATRN
jgi:MPBQ/MSBQ methyltransferase